jgi:hypothetical protein
MRGSQSIARTLGLGAELLLTVGEEMTIVQPYLWSIQMDYHRTIYQFTIVACKSRGSLRRTVAQRVITRHPSHDKRCRKSQAGCDTNITTAVRRAFSVIPAHRMSERAPFSGAAMGRPLQTRMRWPRALGVRCPKLAHSIFEHHVIARSITMTSRPFHPKLSDQLCGLFERNTCSTFFLARTCPPNDLPTRTYCGNVPDRPRRPRDCTSELREHGFAEDTRTVHTL